jgi:RNA polymerase sigma-70 factor (ECF subfamily)
MTQAKAHPPTELTVLSAPFRLRTRVTFEASGTAASSTTKRGLRRITQTAAGKDSLTDAKRLQGDKLTEAEAIERAKQGDAEAFEFLYKLHKRRVYSLCLRMTGNTASAEDLTQEAFLQLFRKIGTFRGESAFSTWLHRMSVNVVLMQLRRKSLPIVPIDEATEGEDEGTVRKELGGPDERLAGSIDRLQLQRAVDELPPGYRTIFVLHDVEGFEHNEIAGIVGCSIGNSKSQLHKARIKMRELLRTNRAEKAGSGRTGKR